MGTFAGSASATPIDATSWVAAVSPGSHPIHCPDHDLTISRVNSERTPRRRSDASRRSSLARTLFAIPLSGSRNGTAETMRAPTSAMPTRSRRLIRARNMSENSLDVSTSPPLRANATLLSVNEPISMPW